MENNATDPRPAATLVILRDGSIGPEVLLTVRPQSFRFMGGAAVFPGGAVDPGDLDSRWVEVSNLTRAEAARRLFEDESPAALGAFVCALREAFEEVGFISGTGPVNRIDRRLAGAGTRWLEHLRDVGVVLDAASLTPAGRWVTPQPSPMRFDTRFFVTRADPKWNPVPDPEEVAQAWWIRPHTALEKLAAGELVMAPPTIHMLHRIADSSNVAEAIQRIGRNLDAPDIVPLSVQVHPQVRLVIAPNPGLMTGPGTNTYVIGDRAACVIDPAVDDDRYLDVIMGVAGIESILITHRHPDHIGGVRAVVDRTGAVVRAWGDTPIAGVDVAPLRGDEVLECAGARLRCIHTPGHASDHLCLQLGDVLFSGDTILGQGTAVIAPPEGNLAHYMESLRRLRSLDISRIFPGHFAPVDRAHELIDEYVSHRTARHRAILQILHRSEASVDEIVEEVYADTSPDLHPLAKMTVMAHLEMAAREGEIAAVGRKWRQIDKRQEKDFP